MLSDDDREQLTNQTASFRNLYFASLGDCDGNWTPIVNPRFNEGPIWPTRPGWQRIKDGQTTMIASSGLTDTGLGIETVIATNDKLPSDLMQMTETWLYHVAVAVSNAAVDGRFALRYEKFGLFLFGVPYDDQINVPSDWICYDDCIGFLIGMSIPARPMTFQLPSGEARLLTAKLLTPAEYLFVADRGPGGAATLYDGFASDGSNYVSSIQRSSIV
jgi:hypothetical protein